MRKQQEFIDLDSCWNKAFADEIVFVLLNRDPTAPGTIRDWAARRVNEGLNTYNDEKIRNALKCADDMEREMHKYAK